MATIKDVAKLAGVSVATVSRVLNNEGNVQPETEKKVRGAIAELHYFPNLLGRNLRRNETKKILVLLNTISNQFYSRVVKGIEECARLRNYAVMVCMTHGDQKIEENYLQMLRTHLVDGAVFLTAEQDGGILSRELAGIPVVQACEPKESFHTPSVSIDNRQAAYEAVRYLIAKGHRRIAFFGAGSVYESSLRRQEGYEMALREAKIPLRKEWIFDEGFSVNAGIRAVNKLCGETGKNDLPTAVFCISDSVAAGAIRELYQRGIRTPDDISIMGFDNTQLSEVYLPSITTTRQPQYEIGYQAMALLLKLIAGEAIEESPVILKHVIIERDSVAGIRERADSKQEKCIPAQCAEKSGT